MSVHRRSNQRVSLERRRGEGGAVGRRLPRDLVGRSLPDGGVGLDVLVVDEDVDLEGLHVDERLRAVIATQIFATSFLK